MPGLWKIHRYEVNPIAVILLRQQWLKEAGGM
ncbi:hypothetical protein EPYR_03547 [Erwinia pyrifoliae DSM 12163]|nr:hypothetical protein EPYR_03547 [Erwinia pyrifoliae DSM 12163]